MDANKVKATLRANSPEVDQYLAMTLTLIEAAGSYASSGTPDPVMSATLRQLQVNIAALQTALNTVALQVR